MGLKISKTNSTKNSSVVKLRVNGEFHPYLEYRILNRKQPWKKHKLWSRIDHSGLAAVLTRSTSSQLNARTMFSLMVVGAPTNTLIEQSSKIDEYRLCVASCCGSDSQHLKFASTFACVDLSTTSDSILWRRRGELWQLCNRTQVPYFSVIITS